MQTAVCSKLFGMFLPRASASELRPDEVADSVTAIDFERLARTGRKYYLFDIDNTLARPSESEIEQSVATCIIEGRRAGYIKGICLISNVALGSDRRIRRVSRIAQVLEAHSVPAIWPRLKPRPWPYEVAFKMLGSRPEETVMVGDQVYTDILGGNRAGCYTIYVQPIDLECEQLYTAWKRPYETRFLLD